MIAIAAGNRHSLALCSDGTLAAWGNNSWGQLGDNTTVYRTTPVSVNTASGTSALFGRIVKAIAAGGNHSLALCSDGTATAWGYNSTGQLGDNTVSQRNTPAAVNTASGTSALFGKTVIANSADNSHSLALCSDGTVAAWGFNGFGELGDNTTTEHHAPVLVNTTSGISALSGKTVTAIGANGSGASHSTIIYATTPPEFEVEVLEPELTALVDNSNTVDYGTTSFGTRTFRIRNTGGLPLSSVTVGISGANASDFIITPPGSAIMPGDSAMLRVAFAPANAGAKSSSLQIASNDSDENPFRISLTGIRPPIIPIEATFNSASDTPFTTNGYNANGASLNLTLNFAPTIGTNLTVIRNAGIGFINGSFSNLANGATVNLTYNGTTYSFVAWYYGGDGNDLVLLWPYTGLAGWGNNGSGQLGDNTTTNRYAPSLVEQTGVLAGKTIVQVARGSYHTLALSSEGKVYAWGTNSEGRLGDGTTTSHTTPVAVNTTSGSSALFGKQVISIAAGDSHSLALCSDGTLAAWGANYAGQIGDNTTAYRITPVAVNTASGTSSLFGKTVTAIAAGYYHSLALCSDGTVAAWGRNENGQLGNDSIDYERYAPVLVNNASGTSALYGKIVTAISAGWGHSIALCSDGTVAAWGSNSSGQLGENTTTTGQRNSPVVVNTTDGISALFGKTVVSIAAGGDHNLALCSDGTVAVWGFNFYGQLGDNTTAFKRIAPVSVNTASGVSSLFGKTVVSIAAGRDHSIALCSDGTVATWGYNNVGQLGDNTTTQHNAPVACPRKLIQML